MAQSGKTFFVRDATGLVREYGPFTALMLGMNNMVGAGIFALSVQAPTRWPGSNIVLAFVIGLVVNLLIALSYTWLATSMPRSGADYVAVSRMINPALSYIVTFGLFAGRIFSVGFLLFTDMKLWGLALRITGLATENTGLRDFGTFLAVNHYAAIAGGIILLATIWAALVKGGRIFSAYTLVIWFIPLLGALLIIGIQLGNPFAPTSFATMWDATYGAGAYGEVIAIANSAGWTSSKFVFNADATVLALATAAMFAFAGFDVPAGIAGEVKRPQKSFYYSMLLGVLITGAIYITLAASTFFAAGDFISQFGFAQREVAARVERGEPGFAAGNLNTAPTIPLFAVVFAGGNPALAFLMAIAGAFALYHVQPAALIKDTRRMFAMAFDNFLPRFLADVSERLHTPVKAITVFAIGGAVGIVVAGVAALLPSQFGGVGALLTAINATFFYMFMAAIVGLAIAVLPFARPEIFDSIKIAKPAVVSLVGVATFGVSSYFLFALAFELWRSSPINILVNASVYTAAAAIFVYYAIKNTKRGIDLKGLFYEIPPE